MFTLTLPASVLLPWYELPDVFTEMGIEAFLAYFTTSTTSCAADRDDELERETAPRFGGRLRRLVEERVCLVAAHPRLSYSTIRLCSLCIAGSMAEGALQL